VPGNWQRTKAALASFMFDKRKTETKVQLMLPELVVCIFVNGISEVGRHYDNDLEPQAERCAVLVSCCMDLQMLKRSVSW